MFDDECVDGRCEIFSPCCSISLNGLWIEEGLTTVVVNAVAVAV